jgi:hypothetical protein
LSTQISQLGFGTQNLIELGDQLGTRKTISAFDLADQVGADVHQQSERGLRQASIPPVVSYFGTETVPRRSPGVQDSHSRSHRLSSSLRYGDVLRAVRVLSGSSNLPALLEGIDRLLSGDHAVDPQGVSTASTWRFRVV